RRRIMKWSLGTVAIVGTIVMLITFGRNDRPGAPNGAPLVAQAVVKEPAKKGEAKNDKFGNPFDDSIAPTKSKEKGKPVARESAPTIEQNNGRLAKILDE